MDYIGRFAPTPSGSLHIGSLLTAVASFLDARAHGGQWLVRMEDLDPPREVAGAADEILHTLEAFALHWDGAVIYQSRRHHTYRAALEDLYAQGLIYACTCSRKRIQSHGTKGADGTVYDVHCRHQAFRQPENLGKTPAYRIIVPDQTIAFHDALVGDYAQNLARDIGDFVLLRADGLWAYQLAVVVDDAAQGITHIVRGQDLLISTPRQIYLQGCLNAPTPHYAHLPLLTNRHGQKWSKQTRAAPLDLNRKTSLLRQVLTYLHLPAPIPDGDCAELLQWATLHWDLHHLPRTAINTENTLGTDISS
ncbi:MAG: tRNA glutamyl-Q(34) synthetase GluQRS [Neisseria sp.]|nr:tRNA glutamyl-Q(34) synthetase GluQRS [Neisseria sp.]